MGAALWLALLQGLGVTMTVFSLTLLFSIPLGILVAIGRRSKIRIIEKSMTLFVLVLRGTPLLLQIVVVFFGLPLVGITFDRMPAVVLAFSLNYAAYFGEIFRGGVQSVEQGQYEAAWVLGMSKVQTFRRILLPQIIRSVLPVTASEVITLVKDTSLVYIVGVSDILRVGRIASNREVSLMPLVAVGLIYLVLTSIFSLMFSVIERRYNSYEI